MAIAQISCYSDRMIRQHYLNKIAYLFQVNPVVALLGPRQCGKTTLARQYLTEHPGPCHYFDLENPIHLAQLEAPMLALEDLRGLIIIDEIQRRPDLFKVLRVLVDKREDQHFLILGSASRDLIRQSSETLAGRISYLECTPFSLCEVDDNDSLLPSHHANALLSRGGFPASYLAPTDEISYQWRQDYISTFLERDIPNLGFRVPGATLRRFWTMLAHYHGQVLNASDLGQSLGVAHTTIRHYLDILTGTFMIRELSPWFENIKKRQAKKPKIYFRDTGIFLGLMTIPDLAALKNHPKLGATWEGFAMEQIIDLYQLPSEQCFYWSIHQQAELDLFVLHQGKRIGFEFKYQDAPSKTTSMELALNALQLDTLYVIYPGKQDYFLAKNIRVVNLESFLLMAKPPATVS